MDSPKYRQTAVVAIGSFLGTAVMAGVFALLGKYSTNVLLGGIVGAALATANFFFLTLFAGLAADKAEKQDVAGGQKLIQLSYMGRMAVMLPVLILCAGAGLHPLALAIPLVLARPILMIDALFRKKVVMKCEHER